MDTTFVLGLMLVFFVLPGMVIAAGLLLILELKPGYLTRHKEKVLAVICIILAVYGASIICTEVEGGDWYERAQDLQYKIGVERRDTMARDAGARQFERRMQEQESTQRRIEAKIDNIGNTRRGAFPSYKYKSPLISERGCK